MLLVDMCMHIHNYYVYSNYIFVLIYFPLVRPTNLHCVALHFAAFGHIVIRVLNSVYSYSLPTASHHYHMF